MTHASLRRLPLLAALLCLHPATQAAPKAPPAVSFDTTPRAGQHQRQVMDMQAVMKMRVEPGAEASEEQRAKIAQAAERMGQMGAIKMTMQMHQTLKVGQADAQGWLPLTVAVAAKGGSMEAGGKTMPLPANKAADVSFAARFNPRDFGFEVQNVEGGSPELAEAMRKQGSTLIGESLQLFKALSQRPLKVGESVDVPMTMALPMPMPGGAGDMQGLVRYTLARVERGVAHFDLGMTLKMEVNAPMPRPASAASDAEAAAAPAQTLQMTITGQGSGSSSLRLSDRLPLATRMAMDMKMTMNGPDNGRMFMDMDMLMQSRGESLARPAAAKKKP